MHGHVKLSYWRSCVVPGVVKSGGRRGIYALWIIFLLHALRDLMRALFLCYQKHGGTVSPGYSGVPYILGEDSLSSYHVVIHRLNTWF